MSCKVYTADQISNLNWNDGRLFNLNGKIIMYSKDIEMFSYIKDINDGNVTPINLRKNRNELFFSGIWYKGGRECKYCKDRVCGSESSYFDDVRR